MFKALAEQLAEAGVASLRIDNAGVGASTGRRVEHFKEREPHVTAALDALAARPELKDAPLGLLGHSEGTMVATRVWANRDPAVDFLILLGAPGRRGREVWVDQQADPARFPDHSPEDRARIRAALEAVADASIAADLTALEAAAQRLFVATGLKPEDIAEIREGFITRMGSAEMRVFLSHDPAPDFARVTDPVLALWGGLDPLTEPGLNASPLLQARNRQGRLTLMVLPGEEHFFLRGDGLAPGAHAFGKMSLSPRLVPTLTAWLDAEAVR